MKREVRDITDELRAANRLPPTEEGMELVGCYVSGNCTAILTRDDGQLHLSVARRDRRPTDDELEGVWRAVVDEETPFHEGPGVGHHPYARHAWEGS